MNEKITTSACLLALAEADGFAKSLEEAAGLLFGGSRLYAQLCEVASRLRENCHRLVDRGTNSTPTIAIVGKVAEGKSWLARCFLQDNADNTPVRIELRCGENDKDRTAQLTWFGPESRFAANCTNERFLSVSTERMIDLGRPYIVGDTPGFSDVSQAGQALSSIAVTSASIKIIIVSLEQLRDGWIADFVSQMDGSLILPIVKFRPEEMGQTTPSETSTGDVVQELNRWKQAAPSATILDACFMPQNEHRFAPQEDGAVETLMRQRLKDALAPRLVEATRLRRAVEQQMGSLINVAKHDAASLLKDFSDRVGGYITRLEAMSRRLPDHLMEELLGEDLLLRAGVRQRIRADWIDRTPSFCFPYRSFLGLLAITAGAWDRLILSVIGSVPSLALTCFQSVRNLRDASRFAERLRAGILKRVEGIVENELHEEVRNFHLALKSLLPEDKSRPNTLTDNGGTTIHVAGLEPVEAESQRIIRTSIKDQCAQPRTIYIFAWLAVVVFWALFAGPVVAIYRNYIQASSEAFGESRHSWTQFPTPSMSMLFTSLLLSAAPVFVLALVSFGWSCRSKRVAQVVTAMKQQHKDFIGERFANGAIRIELGDPRLDSARFLLGLRGND